MSAQRYHHGNLRAALLDAGVALARTGGPSALQVRDLATAVGVSPAAVYRHFPTLAHLLADVSRLGREALAISLRAAGDQVPPPPNGHAGTHALARFAAIGRAYVHFARDEPNLFETAFTNCPAPPSTMDGPNAWGVLQESLDALVATGELSPTLRADAPIIAWSAVHGIASILVRNILPGGEAGNDMIRATLAGVSRALQLRDTDHVRQSFEPYPPTL